MTLIHKKSLKLDILILISTLAIITFGIGNYGLYEPHEGHFAMVAQEMILRKDWLTPYLNGAPYLNKPPLLYWLIAISIKIFGTTEFAVRLPIALSGWLGIIIAWLWSRELWGIVASRIAVIMLTVTTGWFIFTHQLLIDVLLGTLLLASNYFLWKLLSQPKSYIFFLAFYGCLSLCLLTKGLIGIAFPLAGLLGLIIIKRNNKIVQKIKLGQGILLIIAITLPWFIAVEKANPGFLHYFIFNEHLNRIFDRRFPPDYEVSKISALGYLGITAVWCLPWILFFPSVIKFAWQQYQTKHQSAIILLAIAFTLPILVFLPLSSRLIYYSIPAIAPYIILCAGYFSYHSFKIYGFISILIGVVCLSTIYFLPQLSIFLLSINNKTEINQLIFTVLITLGVGFLVAGIAMLRNRYLLSLLSLFIAWTITYIAVTKGFVIYQYLRSSKSLIQTASPCLNLNTLWVFEGSREIGAAGAMSFYLNQNQSDFKTFNQLGWVTGKHGNSYRIVMVLSDAGNNRLPPKFPGELPSYLINKAQLQFYWNSDRNVVFVTDFLRQQNDPNDPPDLNLPQDSGQPLLEIASRKLYGNLPARKDWCQSNLSKYQGIKKQ
ncbi:glycosyl transferase family 39 [Stanieria cyanosphaera PCC 7437]|uniref:Glycosyl transferase family 39 n=1 Tax=Stanieria cyanosphaera (strain ATCC 29371 / PCC 7437) TaxID=111780 RepID=K9XTZ3_STAC7|nr:glycosyltransferase family 39 protein [Stanieria cyanosphaera]AFZ35132.1 glycosyl transferase family 39 [Stanieria cyanosphaera PCC 7437]